MLIQIEVSLVVPAYSYVEGGGRTRREEMSSSSGPAHVPFTTRPSGGTPESEGDVSAMSSPGEPSGTPESNGEASALSVPAAPSGSSGTNGGATDKSAPAAPGGTPEYSSGYASA